VFDDECGQPLSLVRETPFDSATYLQGLELESPAGRTSGRPVALFLAGGPLSGKSTVVQQLADEPESIVPKDAVLVDPRNIRDALPEWGPLYEARDPGGAEAVQREAGHVARGLVQAGVAASRDLVIDGLGAGEPGRFVARLAALNDAGYDVRVLLVDAPTETALQRNDERAERTGLRLEPTRLRTLHAQVSQRFQEWRELPWLRWEMYGTG